ncbi:MAG TPA: hypothetical protein VLZ75_06350 [Chitinophagales bacterium]|nr:hypothetical protein [Chitinophagales bacterium]
MKQQRFLLLALSFILVVGSTWSCKKDDVKDKPKEEEPAVSIFLTTKDITKITIESAKSGAIIEVKGKANIDEVGICWSTSSNPTIKNSSALGSGKSEVYNNSNNSFDIDITDLDSTTTYYVRAYAKYKDSVYYGMEEVFKTIGGAVVESQYWTLGDIINADSLLIINAEDDEAVVFSNGKSVGAIKFSGGLQAPYEYSVINAPDSLLTLQAHIQVIYNDGDENNTAIWNSVNFGNSKVKTYLENGKVKVEFKDVQMKNVKDGALAYSSASFYVEF